jgi:hypothetical protein
MNATITVCKSVSTKRKLTERAEKRKSPAVTTTKSAETRTTRAPFTRAISIKITAAIIDLSLSSSMAAWL